jgi:hypothetical protein
LFAVGAKASDIAAPPAGAAVLMTMPFVFHRANIEQRLVLDEQAGAAIGVLPFQRLSLCDIPHLRIESLAEPVVKICLVGAVHRVGGVKVAAVPCPAALPAET